MRAITLAVGTTLALVVAVATGCGQGSGDQNQQPDTAAVVASTDVWGSVASAVAREHATVSSILDSAVNDPHSFEASPADVATITDASLVVYNGGGYDAWVDDVLAAHPDVQSVNAYALRNASEHPDNEHVFYDLPTAKAVAARVADRLAEADPARAHDYHTNAAEFGAQADEILASARTLSQTHPDASVISTEPVAHYLLANAGLAEKTPPGFTDAIEQGTDPSPADLAAVLDLIESRDVSALLFNPQTESAVTRQIRDAAHRASVPIVTVTETLPAETDYLTWQRQSVEQLAHQLDAGPRPNR